MKKGKETEWIGNGGVRTECEIRLLSKIARLEQIIRHLHITLNNTVRLLEKVRPYVPNILEWDNMLDHYYRVLKTSDELETSQKSHLSLD